METKSLECSYATQSGTTSLLLWKKPNLFKGAKFKRKRHVRKKMRFTGRKQTPV